MTKKSISLLLFSVLVISSAWASVPSGYYDNAKNKSGSTLITALYNIIKDHTVISYANLWDAFKYTDVDANGKIIDMYANTSYDPDKDRAGNYSTIGDVFNREHSFPKSWFGEASPMVSDLFHIYPTDGYVNNQRSNYLFGECSNGTRISNDEYTAKGRLGTCTVSGYTGTVWEPDDEYKGDFARTYFYMVTRYNNLVSSWASNTYITDAIDANSYPVWKDWYITMLLEWSRLDPVSDKETTRNDVIYTSYQKNRNPFIDHPELAEYLWGTHKGETWTGEDSDDSATKTLSSIAITGTPTKTAYTVGSTFSTSGLTVTATYSDGTTADVTSSVTWSFSPTTIASSTSSVTATATYSGKTASQTYTITITTTPETTSKATLSADDDADIKFVKQSSGSATTAVWVTSTPLSTDALTFSGSGSSNYSYYDGSVVRFYTDNTLTITPADGVTITKIEIVRSTSTSSNTGTITCSNLTASSSNTTTNTNVYEGSTTSTVTMTTSAQSRFTAIYVYYSTGSSSSVSIANTPATAYTVAEAIALYKAGNDLTTKVYVKGIVSKLYSSTVSNSGTISFYVNDDGSAYSSSDFEFYGCYNIDGAKFTSIDQVQVGAEVIGYGTLSCYSGIYEFAKDCQLVSYVAPPTETTLTNLYSGGTVGSKYTVTGSNLMAVKSFSKDDKNYVIVKDGDNAVNNFVASSDITGEAYTITDNTGKEHAQESYAQNNWMLLEVDELPSGNNITSITGTLANATNVTLTDATITLADGTLDSYSPNYYTPINFMGSTSVASSGDTKSGTNYFFMKPKNCEFAVVTYAMWKSGDNFYIPNPDTGVNGNQFQGGFTVDWSYNNGDVTLQSDVVYEFQALIMAKESSSSSNARRKIQADTREYSTSSYYTVYPLNLSNQTVTGVTTVKASKTVSSMKYFNIAGQASDHPFSGVNIVVTHYTDGTTSARKLIK